MSKEHDFWEELLSHVRKPSRYLGREKNVKLRPFEEARLKICLIFPDLYEIGMSHLGLLILYLILTQREEYAVDRAYAPGVDLEKELRKRRHPFLSLDYRRPLKEFDLLGISFPYELCATNIVNILDLAGIPPLAQDRPEEAPLVLGGGSAMANPEPVADFYDAIIIGEAEEAILEVCQVVCDLRQKQAARREILEALSEIPGLYVPSFFRPVYQKGRFHALEPLRPGYEVVKRRLIPHLDQVPYPWRPPVPWAEITHDRLALEISRGCTRGCRFCQASSLYRPVRERSLRRLLEMAEEGLSATGWDEISFLSLSAGDYSCLTELLALMNRRFLPERVALSLPSLRVGSLNEDVIQEIKKVRKTGFTLAPEAGTERLRRVINKDISEEALWETALKAFEAGWRHLKLYFMIGLPTETPEDLEGIVRLAKRLTKIKKRQGPQVNVSVSTFVPKPHTAFQWEEQIGLSETKSRLAWLKGALRGRKLRLKWHLPEQSLLEGVFSRGDRRLSRLVLEAHRLGARLDGWSEEFRFSLWLKAAQNVGLDLGAYLRARALKAPLPWDHIDLGVKKTFLWEERARALEEKFSPDCRFTKCLQCGTCDFKEIRNRLEKDCTPPRVEVSPPQEEGRFFYRVYYQKRRWARFLSQLELMRVFHRAIRRAKLPVAFSAGFHPLPKVSFPRALPVGVESEKELFALELVQNIAPEEVKRRLSGALPPVLSIIKVVSSEEKEMLKIPEEFTYEIELKVPLEHERLQRFLESQSVKIRVQRGGKEKEREIRPYVLELRGEGNKLYLTLWEPSQGGVRAQEVVAALFGLSPQGPLPIKKILKLAWKE